MPGNGEKRDQIESMPRTRDIGPVAPEELAFAINLTYAATSYKMPMRSPANRGFRLEDEGDTTEFQFTDAPFNRCLFALAEHASGDTQQFYRVSFRIFALSHIMRGKEVRRRLERSGSESFLNAIIEVASSFPLSRGIRFKEGPFLERVDETARADRHWLQTLVERLFAVEPRG
jgi:hypothetical protein